MPEPTPDSLRALAGWSLTKQALASDQQSVALSKLRDSCEVLANNFPASVKTKEQPPTRHVIQEIQERRVAPIVQELCKQDLIPAEVLAAVYPNVVQPDGSCAHKFHIVTQKCVYCGLTYLAAKGRKSELMG